MAAKNPSNQLEKTTIICYFQKLIYIIFWPTLQKVYTFSFIVGYSISKSVKLSTQLLRVKVRGF